MLHRVLLAASMLGVSGCTPSSSVSPADASRWSDVTLPDAGPPEGSSFIVTLVEAGVAVTEPSGMCGGDGGDGMAPSDFDAWDAGPCTTPMAPGDLMMDEVMVSTVSGRADRGQWLEVRNTRRCSVDLIGLHAEAPTGSSFHTLDVNEDVWIPGGGFFVIADSLDPTINNDLPGLAIVWADAGEDILHKTEDTVTLSVGSLVIDTLTYHPKSGVIGISLAFPSNCAPALRSDFSNWQLSTASWTPGFFGTPNAPNDDVRCSDSTTPLCVVNGSATSP